MNKIHTLSVMNAQRMTSLEIAELTGKPHNDVLKAIRKMEEAWMKVNGGKFSLVDYKDAKGELRPCYSLSKTECLYIATKFNDEARAKLVIRWQQLEQDRLFVYYSKDGKQKERTYLVWTQKGAEMIDNMIFSKIVPLN